MTGKLGKSLPVQNFRAIEFDAEIDQAILAKHIMDGSTSGFPVVLIRNAVERRVCDQICANFLGLVDASGGSRSKDVVVSVSQIGAHQFDKMGSEYLRMVDKVSQQVDALFQGLTQSQRDHALCADLVHRLAGELGVTFRPAMQDGKKSALCTARSWAAPGSNSLLAHEDFSQLSVAARDGFEITNVSSVVAYNLCLANETGGELVVWNLEPSLKAKEDLHVQTTGYPYPQDWLEGIPFIEIKLNPGDAYFLKANLIHAVRATPPKSRATLGRFLGWIESGQEIVYWT